MDASPMNSPFVFAALALLLGFAVGLVHFLSLKRVAALYLGGSVGWPIALQLIRLAILVVMMVWLAKAGALPLLAGALGVILARIVVLRLAGKEA
ncbi:hypothetical protein BMG00_16120 [Thioclava marina]|uniref:ATP synthase subunit I n=2 Tax=Paracoccaceae TaxID=31989 RepID=A0ABX3MMC5_9RHOB|nr:hypothetical protein BMG00_16120 [Thioclava marina]OOY26965.1 hypothetical protein BMI90_14715 [Thioclava sp. L04-15]TNE83004.1 MAG: hypothetical protein EP337_17630 [Paracoccaceae bacterium]